MSWLEILISEPRFVPLISKVVDKFFAGYGESPNQGESVRSDIIEKYI